MTHDEKMREYLEQATDQLSEALHAAYVAGRADESKRCGSARAELVERSKMEYIQILRQLLLDIVNAYDEAALDEAISAARAELGE